MKNNLSLKMKILLNITYIKSNDKFTSYGYNEKSYTLKAKLYVLGVTYSYSRPRVINDNPFSEAQFKTMKYRLGYPKDGFTSIEEAREWVSKFVNWYNNEHYHSRIKFMPPNSRHNGETKSIMNNRIKVYEAARVLNPAGFNKD